MPPRALLDLATELLRSLLRFDAPADAVVSAFFRRQRALGPRERHTLAETAYAVLRRRLTLQHLAQGGRGAIERRLAILGWQGDAGFLRAALAADEREWLDRIAQVDRASLPVRLRHELPAWVAEALQAGFGADFDALAASLLEPAPLDLRVNTLATTREAAQAALAAAGMQVNEVAPAEVMRMREKVRPVWDEFSKEVGPGLFNEVSSELAKLRKR